LITLKNTPFGVHENVHATQICYTVQAQNSLETRRNLPKIIPETATQDCYTMCPMACVYGLADSTIAAGFLRM
jgi:hypothetical protein